MNFLKACKDVLENDTKYEREGNIGIRKRMGNRIEFYSMTEKEVFSIQAVVGDDLKEDWKIIGQKKTLSDKLKIEELEQIMIKRGFKHKIGSGFQWYKNCSNTLSLGQFSNLVDGIKEIFKEHLKELKCEMFDNNNECIGNTPPKFERILKRIFGEELIK